MPSISVIIPTYNTGLLIERALASVLGQEEALDLEVLAVDDASTDDTVAVVKKMGDERIRVLRQSENRGPAAARNRGLREARGEFCAFLDGDDFWEPTFLAETVKFLQGHPEAVAVSVMQCHKLIGKEPSIVPQNTGVTAPVVLEDFFDFWGRFNHVCTGSVLFRRETALAIGGQREELRICEDLEFWAMLATYGKWGFIPKVLFTSDGGVVTQKQGWLEKNMRRWQSAPSFAEWRKRIYARKTEFCGEHLEFALGKISRNLCYCHIQCGKDALARAEARNNGAFFPKNRVNRLFLWMAVCPISWKLWCAFLRRRERKR